MNAKKKRRKLAAPAAFWEMAEHRMRELGLVHRGKVSWRQLAQLLKDKNHYGERGVSHAAISRARAGDGSWETLEQIADVLKIPLPELRYPDPDAERLEHVRRTDPERYALIRAILDRPQKSKSDHR